MAKRRHKHEALPSCHSCGKPLARGSSTIRITIGLSIEVGLGTAPSYVEHENCVDPIALMLTLVDSSFLLLEKGVDLV